MQAPDPRGQPPLPFAAALEYERRAFELAARPLPEGLRLTTVAYGPHAAQCMDVYVPRDARAPGTLVFWHGGGWTNGYREWVRFMAPAAAQNGLALVAPSYRLVHEARLPAALDDCEAALTKLAVDAGRLELDATRLVLAGHSAGGHLAAMMALRSTPNVRGCMPVSAILDLHHPAPPPDSLDERVYTMVLSDHDDDARLSPIHWTRGNRVPFRLTCGEHDSERVLRSNRRMHALLSMQPGGSVLEVVPGADHFSTHLALDDPQHRWYAQVVRLLDG